jgi:hypothetical protein
MAARLEAISEADLDEDHAKIEISAADLLEAVQFASISNPTYEYAKLTDVEWQRWSGILHTKFNWATRKRYDTGEYAPLTTLLKEAWEFWAMCYANGMTYDETKCYRTIAQYIRTASTCSRGGNAALQDAWLKYTAQSTGLGQTIINPKASLKASDFQVWAEQLQRQYGLASREPPLVSLLQSGRMAWQRTKGEPPISVPLDRYVKATITTTETTTTVADTTPKAKAQKEGGSLMRSTGFSEVLIEDADSRHLWDVTTTISRQCDFCQKETPIHSRTGTLLHRLSGDSQFFCLFCTRHDLHTKKRKHVLILTYRGLIGYLYHACYQGKTPRLYVSEIYDLIRTHIQIGEQNPVFTYDPETYCWFIDFTKVGNTKHKVTVQEVLRTVNEIISAFNPYEHIKDFKSHKLVEKYTEAVMDFYSKRYRPEGRRICSPTLVGCACETREVPTQHNTTKTVKMNVAEFRTFTPNEMRPSTRR